MAFDAKRELIKNRCGGRPELSFSFVGGALLANCDGSAHMRRHA